MATERVERTIERLQRAEEEVRRLQDELIDEAEARRAETLAALREAVVEGLGQGEGPEVAAALVPVAEVLGELEGPEVCDLLVDLLGCEEPEVRFTAGRALQDLAFDRFKEVAEAVERAADRLPGESAALRELPFVVSEVTEPGVPRVLRKYLAHAEAEVVAAAIEALASLGDASALPDLRRLLRDPRTVQIDDDQGEAQASLGTLAEEAIDMLGGEPAPPPRSQPPADRRAPRPGHPKGGRGRR